MMNLLRSTDFIVMAKASFSRIVVPTINRGVTGLLLRSMFPTNRGVLQNNSPPIISFCRASS